MKNKTFLKALESKGFVAINENTLVLKVRDDHSVIIHTDEDSEMITVSNFYKETTNEYDGGKSFVLFSGHCNNMTDFKELVNILNFEDDTLKKLKL